MLQEASPIVTLDVSEEQRIAAVMATGVFNANEESEFRELAELASEICGTAMGLVSLIGRDTQMLKGAVGLKPQPMPREMSFCNTTIGERKPLIVENATTDARFRRNPLVTSDPGIRFYAGVPMTDVHGMALGALCVLDRQPRQLEEWQMKALTVLARQTGALMELRTERRRLEAALVERRRIVKELEGSEYRFRKFMDHAPFISFIKDGDGRFVFYNRAMAERFKISMREWMGKGDFELWPREIAEAFRKTDLEVLRSGHKVEKVEETRDADGNVTCWKSYKFPLRNENGEVWLGGFSIDLTVEAEQRKQLQKANQNLERLATTDALTGLANRRVLDERLEIEYQAAMRRKTPLAVVMLDLDNFKQLNDTLGHASGDAVLRRMGRLIASTLRATDMGARYGGEEMSMLLPGATTEGALLLVERLRAAMLAADWPGGRLTASFGVAELKHTMKSGKRLLELADDSMYDAKRTGKDKVVTEKELMQRLLQDAALRGE